ncbi:tyrosine-protein phosphatase [Dactylosporangium vinaceum]|uniref:Tyrosine-protein phosphatase n=1 Tax=Dactylosporangium vinaceum TaxID=53362 RepID=A0ABV5MJJ8_9ACTN|nr:tyrosine-protein phosphatase [Dactylosporangium vinaceum]UAB93554.1 tyrosine-protein phosphatase [Dactylosporangium vinaceum]
MGSTCAAPTRPPGAVLVHCAAGQDRTGMLIALLLRVAGVPDAVIAEDYAYSAVCWQRPDECEPATIRGALERVDERFGGVEAYLRAHGLTDTQLTALCDRLVA